MLPFFVENTLMVVFTKSHSNQTDWSEVTVILVKSFSKTKSGMLVFFIIQNAFRSILRFSDLLKKILSGLINAHRFAP